MFKNYFKIALRNIKDYKGYSFINIFGLAVGMAVSMLIIQFVAYELSYDKFNENYDNIYRVRLDDRADTFFKFGPAAKETFPEVEEYVRICNIIAGGTYSYKEKIFTEDKVFWASEAFFQVFSYKLISGDPVSALTEPNSIVISEMTAKKYFQDENPIGKTLSLNNNWDFQVSGVMENPPQNSHLKFDLLLSYKTLINITTWADSWLYTGGYTYLKLKPGTNVKNLESKFPEFFKQRTKKLTIMDASSGKFFLQPLKDIHLHSHFIYEAEENGDWKTINILTIIAFLILIIAWFNYINLSTVQSMKRAKEVGIRKVSGASRVQLINQYLSETFVVNLSSFIFAIIIFKLSLPYFDPLMGMSPSFTLLSQGKVWFVIGIVLIVGTLISGLYPAFVLSSHNPNVVLKSSYFHSNKGKFLRKVMVIFQFAVSTAMIAGIFTVSKQLNFMLQSDICIDVDNVIVIRLPRHYSAPKRLPMYTTFKNDLEQIPSIKQVSTSYSTPGEDIRMHSQFRKEQDSPDNFIEVYENFVSSNFIDFFQLNIIAGRNFSNNLKAEQGNVIINETAAKMLGFNNPEDAIDRKIFASEKNETKKIIAVVKNYHQESLRVNFEPMIIWNSDFSGHINIKISETNIDKTISLIKEKFSEFYPGNPFEYYFLNEQYKGLYNSEERFNKIILFFSILAVIVSCLGLLGLTSFNILLRRKEIGVRKILGATIPGIILMLIKDLIILIAISIFMALPISYLYFSEWLSNYPFRIDIEWWFIALPSLFIFLIAILTVFSHTVKAANANPVDSLKYE